MSFNRTNWDYFVSLTINSDEVDASLSNVPVYVDLSNLPTGFWENVNADGSDIRVVRRDNAEEMAREIVFIDTGTSTGELHFKADNLSSSSDTTFNLFYGNASASAYAADHTFGRNAVWSNNFVGVWHLQEDPSGTAPQMVDSTGNGNDLTTQGSMASSDSVSGKLSGNALQFSDTTYATVADNATFDWEQVTITSWAQTATLANDGAVFAKDGGGTSEPLTWLDEGVDDFTFACNLDSGFVNGSSGGSYTVRSVDTWYHTAGKFTGTEVEQRVNAVQNFSEAVASTGIANTASDVGVGAEADGSRSLNGLVDEVRAADVARSDAWTDMQYSNQNDPTNFYTVSAHKTTPSASSRYRETFE